MGSYMDSLLKAIRECDIPAIEFCISQGVNVNKICMSGVTPLTVAVQCGNLPVIKLLAESTVRQRRHRDIVNDNNNDRFKNIGYFVVCRGDIGGEGNNAAEQPCGGFGDGPTPDGMDALEWDMEVDEAANAKGGGGESSTDSSGSSSPSGGGNNASTRPRNRRRRRESTNIYKWCANILNRTSILLDSPEYDISRLDTHGQNVLHYAIKSGSTEIVDYLIKNYDEININQCDANWCSPLHIAAQHQCTELVQYLVARGADVNATNTNRQTPLHFAALTGCLALVEQLINYGANVNAFDIKDRTALSFAVQQSHEDIALLLIARGTKLNQEECFGDTVLYKAVRNKLCLTVKHLLGAGAKMVQSHMLLHVAIRLQCLEMVCILCAAGALVNIRDSEGYTPLMTACVLNQFEIAEYLISHGASVNVANQITSLTALHLCVQNVFDPLLFSAFLRLLLDAGADVLACGFHGSLMFHALVVRNTGAAYELVRAGAIDVNRREPFVGFDYLSLAKKHGNMELVQIIVLAGFDWSNLAFDMRTLRTGGDDAVYEYMAAARRKPLTLRELCRIVVRRRVGTRARHVVSVLPLPAVMRRYLMFEIV